ncbi:MAG: helicase-exonuclease AddAB subunit AddA [Eubacteriales bacterium]|nr:helicase-exonuclease AddAB subunit AddA [Eubacteriales bacterium]
MAEKLTPQQSQAVHDRGGRLLVSAAAGSGKTKVLVDRLLEYMTSPRDPANLDDFLIITYTKAAASELRGKIAAKLSQRIAAEPENRHLQKQMQRLFLTKISTVHGFCGDLLREYAYRLDLSADFRVADENECRELRDTVMEAMLDRTYGSEAMSEDFKAFVDTQGLGRDDGKVPQIVEKVYDSARCHLDPDGWLDECLAAARVEEAEDAAETLWGRYLMEDMKEYLACHIRVLTRCIQEADKSEGMEKPAGNLRQTLVQLQILAGAPDWDTVHRNRTIDYGRLVFPKKNCDEDLAARIKAARNACKQGMERKLRSFADDSRQLLEDLRRNEAGARGLVALVRQFERDFQSAKKSRRVLDFSDLEQKTLDLLLGKSRTAPTAAALEIGRRYREVLVDEYQDSNAVQDAIFSALTQERHNGFLVGDVKQSIYQFRLADPGIFLEKYHSFIPADQAQPGQGRKVLLSHNFRSGAEVIDAVNQVFETCMRPHVGGLHYGQAEALREGVPHIPLGDAGTELYAIEVREDTYAEEAAFVAERIQTMLKEGTLVRQGDTLRPVEPQDIVILLRSPGSAGGYFQRALEQRGIRCASGGGTDLLQTQEIGTLRSFLQTIVNPRQDIPLLSTLASPIFGFTADDLAAIRSGRTQGPFYDALLKSDSPRVRSFLETLDRLRRKARMDTLTALLEACFTETRLDSVYAAMDGGTAKSANLQEFFQLAAQCEKGSLLDLSQFLDHLDAMEARGLVSASAAGADSVSIMSIHKSKGLEFPVVFLCNLSRKFNQESLRAPILCDKTLGLGLSAADHDVRVRYPSLSKGAIAAKMEQESVSEEMRVLYVAMTRAKDRLIMTYAARNLPADLQDAALRQDFDGGELLCRDAICLGDWVLLAALRRTEAGALHALGGRPMETVSDGHPWNIQVTAAPEEIQAAAAPAQQRQPLPGDAAARLKQALAFRYPHQAATVTPSKQTATGRKGRVKDAEAAEKTREPKPLQRTWRAPAFAATQTSQTEYGTVIHAALQYIRYENCGSPQAVAGEIQELVEKGFLTADQGAMVDCGKIAAFFATPLGEKLRAGADCLREFKFSILDRGSHYGDDLEGEQVLLQGVVDCALLEADGITVVDFKTDRVTAETQDAAARRYAPQIRTYGEALSRIYEKPIKHRYLYFFQTNSFVEICAD